MQITHDSIILKIPEFQICFVINYSSIVQSCNPFIPIVWPTTNGGKGMHAVKSILSIFPEKSCKLFGI